jgi:PAS domain S-box-containing protein
MLFESNPQPMWVHSLESMVFLAVNDAAVKHYGYSHDEFLRMTLKDLEDELEAPPNLVNGTGVSKHRKKDGTPIEVELTAHGLFFDERPARLVLAQDITERRALEDQLRQAQKMERSAGLPVESPMISTIVDCNYWVRRSSVGWIFARFGPSKRPG